MSWTPEPVAVAAKPKHTLLPILIVLFLLSYGLMALLVVEQARTIDNQRGLIQSLFSDSNQLSHLKGKEIQQQHAAAQAQAGAKTNSSAQTPSAQGPSTQVLPGDTAKGAHGASKLRKTLPEKPPKSTADNADERRGVLKI